MSSLVALADTLRDVGKQNRFACVAVLDNWTKKVFENFLPDVVQPAMVEVTHGQSPVIVYRRVNKAELYIMHFNTDCTVSILREEDDTVNTLFSVSISIEGSRSFTSLENLFQEKMKEVCFL